MPAHRPIEIRFWEKVDRRSPDECWWWTGSVGSHGYGQLADLGTVRTTHRLSWELHNGPIPKGEGAHGICVCHTCDVRTCVNPGHLFLGTQRDNLKDMRDKGRAFDPPRRRAA